MVLFLTQREAVVDWLFGSAAMRPSARRYRRFPVLLCVLLCVLVVVVVVFASTQVLRHGTRPPRHPWSFLAQPERAPTVTILTSVYNPRCDLLAETAASIQAFTYPGVSWMIVNDHSTTPPCKAFDKATVVDHLGERGPGPARQAGLDIVETEYICMLDGDDKLLPEAIEKAIWVMETQPGLAMTGWFLQEFGFANGTWLAGFHGLKDFFEANQLIIATVMRQKALRRCGARFRTDFGTGMEDWEFWLQLVECGLTGHTIPTRDFLYRTRDPSLRVKEWPSMYGNGYQDVRAQIQLLHPRLATTSNFPSHGYGTRFNDPDAAAIVSAQPPPSFNFVLPRYAVDFNCCKQSISWVGACGAVLVSRVSSHPGFSSRSPAQHTRLCGANPPGNHVIDAI